jgi:hypothetical protein
MNRREFGKLAGTGALVLASGASVTMTGCNPITDLENWIPVALAALSGIVKILGVSNPIIALIQAAFAALLAALQNYKAGTGPISDVANAVSDVETSFQNFFASLNIPAALLNTIEALGTVILSTLQGFANLVLGTTTASMVYKLAGRTVAFTPQKRTIRRFKKDYNAAAVAGGHPEIEMKLGFWEKF